MDIRKFFGGPSAAPRAAAPTSTLSELRKKKQEQEKAVKSPSPKKTATKNVSHKKAVDSDDDSVIEISHSPPPKVEKPVKRPERSSPRKKSKGKSAPRESEKTSHKAKEKPKDNTKTFQLLDDDDLDIDDPDDDFVPVRRSPRKAGGRKRASVHPKGSKGHTTDENGSEDDEAVVRKKAKVGSTKKRRSLGDDDEAQAKHAKKEAAKKKKDIRIIDSDEEEEDAEAAELRKHERKEKAAMKRAMKPDSHGLRNQDISSAVAASASNRKEPAPKPSKPEAASHFVKDISAEAFFGAEPVKHHRNPTPKKVQSPSVSVDDVEPMVIDEQNKPVTPSPRKHQTKKTPQSHSTSKAAKHGSAASEEYVLHAPLSPKVDDNHTESTTPTKNPTITTPQTATDRRKSNYFEYIHREPPKHLGEKELPTGPPTCLEGLAFVLTGVLESFERDDIKAALEKMGARVVGSISKKTNYVIVGREAGPSKLDKARSMKIPVLDEDALLELVHSKKAAPHKGSSAKTPTTAPHKAASAHHKHEPKTVSPHKSPLKKEVHTKIEEDEKKPVSPAKHGRRLPASFSQPTKAEPVKHEAKATSSQPPASSEPSQKPASTATELWVDKYRPKTVKNIIGQGTEQSCVNKLLRWLRNWNRNIHIKPNFGPFAKNPEGLGLRAALLSGPPGIGKTTSAHLVCKELGISLVEMNASDTRSKKSLESWVSALLQSKSIDTCGFDHKKTVVGDMPDHCLIMDEVDGMAGNEDRGGIAELIALIKKAKIPVICICNDRAAQKIRSLANYCLDLRFMKPNPAQIKGAMLSMTCKEGVRIPSEVIAEVIEATNSDLRQVINQLQMYSSQQKGSMGKYHAKKDVRLGIFQLADKIFSYEENRNMRIQDRMDLFFQDYSLAPLFVHENYAHVWPHRAASMGAGKATQCKSMQLVAKAADSLSCGDVFERKIRSTNDWSMLSGQALMSCAIPSWLMSGSGRCNNFPGWFGKTSHAGRISRMVQQLGLHTSIATGVAAKTSFALDYVPALRRAVLLPLLREGDAGVAKVIEVFEFYDLVREDLDALLEVDQWPGKADEWKQVDSKVKASLTRQYNKSHHMTHYAMTAFSGGKKRTTAAAGDGDLEGLLGEGEESRDSESDRDGDDPMVKQSSKKGKGRAAASTTTRGGGGGRRGHGRGRGGKK